MHFGQADRDTLITIFRRLGLRNAEGLAREQIEKGIDHLAPTLFLRTAWRCVVDEDAHGWMDAEMAVARAEPNASWAGIGQALESVIEAGVDRATIAELVRGMQAKFMFELFFAMSFPDSRDDGFEKLTWSFVECDVATGEHGTIFDSPYSEVLMSDPTGRELRPRKPRA